MTGAAIRVTLARASVLLLMALATAAPTQARSSAPPPRAARYASAFDGQRQAYVMLIRLRQDLWQRYRATGTWPDDAEANAALSGHVAYWRDQLAAGPALFAGAMEGDFWDNASFIVFELPAWRRRRRWWPRIPRFAPMSSRPRFGRSPPSG